MSLWARALGVCGALTAICAVLYALAPVIEHGQRFSWSPRGSQANIALPLITNRPASLSARIPCSAARAVATGEALLATTPVRGSGAPTGIGLWIGRIGENLAVYEDAVPLWRAPIANGECSWQLAVNSNELTVGLGPGSSTVVSGDHRPRMTGLFTQLLAGVGVGMTVDVVADTRFDTTPSPLKLVLGAISALGLVGLFGAAFVLDRRTRAARDAGRASTRRRPRVSDLVVVAATVVWWPIAPLSVDDGFIMAMIRDSAGHGHVDAYYDWLNTPEAPFGWYYTGLRVWSDLVGTHPLWMRVPSVIAGLLSWLLLSRSILPRVCPRAAHMWWVGPLAAMCWLASWLPFGVGLRSEPFVVLGVLACWSCLEYALAQASVVALLVGVVAAVATAAIAPTGLIAIFGVIGFVPALRRVMRSRPDVGMPALLGGCCGATLAVLLIVFAELSVASVRSAVAFRTETTEGGYWYQEFDRYAALATIDVQGSVDRRLAVSLMLLGVAGMIAFLLVGRRRVAPGCDAGAVRRSVLFGVAAPVSLALAPTKWTHHFGIFAGLSTVLIVLLAWSAIHGRGGARYHLTLVCVMWAVAAWVWGADYIWWRGITGQAARRVELPRLFGAPLDTVALLVAAVAATAIVLSAVRPPSTPPRWTGFLVPATIAIVVATTLGGAYRELASTALRAGGGYSVERDNLTALTRPSCALGDALRVETDPAAGLLERVPGALGQSTVSGSIRAGALPSWRRPHQEPYNITAADRWAADPVDSDGSLTTGWYLLPPAALAGAAPVVVTTVGGATDAVTVEFARRSDDQVIVQRTVPITLDNDWADTALTPPAGAHLVRIRASSAGTGSATILGVTAPRVPRLTNLSEVFSHSSAALVGWPATFLFPCQQLARLSNGVVENPDFVVSSDIGGIVHTSSRAGSTFAQLAQLDDFAPIPVYDGTASRPTEWALRLYRVRPLQPLGTPANQQAQFPASGWRPQPPL